MRISKEKLQMICIFILLLVLFGNAFAEPIHEYVGDGNVEEVKRLIKEGADVNAKDFMGYTPLHWAVIKGDNKIIEILISNGAYVNGEDKDGYTPLHLHMPHSK